MPNSRPPKNCPASVSSWAKPWTVSGGNRSARDSQIVSKSRQRLSEAIVPGGWIKRGGALAGAGHIPLVRPAAGRLSAPADRSPPPAPCCDQRMLAVNQGAF